MTRLLQIEEELGKVEGLSVLERGNGAAAFLYVRSAKRAAEVSIDEGVRLFVEYWDSADEQSDDAPLKSETIASDTEALIRIKNWLLA